MVCGPAPCDAPDPVVTLMPLVEFRQQLLIRATESAGYQNIQLCRRRDWPKRQHGKDDE
jgi:hypothetical protein